MIVVAFGLGLVLRRLKSDGGAPSPAPESVATVVTSQLQGQPQQAAAAALEVAHSGLSPEAELAMIDVAVDGKDVEVTVDAGAEVTAALVLEAALVTAGRDGMVKVWSRSDGRLFGETEAPVPIALLAETEFSSPVLAAVDRGGGVALIDAADPGRPTVQPLDAHLAPREAPLAVAFSQEATEIVVVGVGGEVLRLDATTGAVLRRSSLRTMKGDLPWTGDAELDLAAAQFAPEVYDDEEGLLVGTAEGAVADVDLLRGQGKTILDRGIVPGRILSLDRAPYEETELAVAASGGAVTVSEEADEPSVYPGPAVTGIAIDEGDLWIGGKEGVFVGEYFDASQSGLAVLAFDPSFDGIAAINPGGKVSVLAPPDVPLSMAETETTSVSAFDPDGRLLLAEGYDANHVEELQAVRPQSRILGEDYQEDDVVQTYEPGPDWWPGADDPESLYEEENGLYLNDVASDGDLVAAGGQDPTGTAAVMAWDAESGKPLAHLPLGTGGVETELPSIVSEVMLLPGKHEIAAYSVTQELVAIWSTDTWELEDSVPVGPAGDVALSPDESTIVVVGITEASEGYVEADEKTPLKFVDVDSGEVTDEVPARGVTEAAFSPDGSTLALGDQNGYVRLRSADGRRVEGPLVDVGGGSEALAWRPDGDLLAVALSQGGVVLVDPESGQASEPLPPREAYAPALDLSWSTDGSMLATLNPIPEEEGEGYDPGPTTIWTLGAEDLEQRMCSLSACRSGDKPAGSRLGDASRLSSVDLVFRRKGELFAADLEGDTARIGRLDEFPTPPVSYDWSPNGFAWLPPGHVSVLLEGDEKPRSWPCSCSGVAWSGDEVLALESNGKNLIRIDPEEAEARATPVRGLPRFSPALLGVVGESPVVAAFESEPDRSTPSALFELRPDGVAKKLTADAHGSIYLRWPSSSPRTLAFGAGLSGGACYSTTNVGVVSKGPSGIQVSFPTSPLGKEAMTSLRSLQVAADGTVSAALGGIGCNDSGMPQDRVPPAERYRLERGRWQPTGEKGYDVQVTGDGTQVVEEAEGFAQPGTLYVEQEGDRRRIATEVEGVVARP